MDKARKRQLKEQYKQMKPDMGVFVLRNTKNNKCFLEASTDMKSMDNRIRFQLKIGMFPNKPLQQDWKAQNGQEFIFEVIDKLAYSKDESKTDYKDDIKTLKAIWMEKLETEEKWDFYE